MLDIHFYVNLSYFRNFVVEQKFWIFRYLTVKIYSKILLHAVSDKMLKQQQIHFFNRMEEFFFSRTGSSTPHPFCPKKWMILTMASSITFKTIFFIWNLPGKYVTRIKRSLTCDCGVYYFAVCFFFMPDIYIYIHHWWFLRIF